MKSPILLFYCLLPSVGLAQALIPDSTHRNPSGCARVCDLAVPRGSATATELAEQDIQAKMPYLIHLSGEAYMRPTPAQVAFQKQFSVRYYQVGCLIRSVEDASVYNSRIFDYLQATYGKTWRRKVWASVAGWEEWKRSH